MQEPTLFIRTGGTVDAKAYKNARHPPKVVETLNESESKITAFLATRENVDLFHWGLCEQRFVKDSKKFSEEELAAIAKIIRDDERNYFVISHGTDKMVENAQKLKQLLADSGKTVALMGTMVPFSMDGSPESEAIKALEFTLDTITQCKEGVYIASHSINEKTQKAEMVFSDPDTIKKDFETSLRTLRFTTTAKSR